MISFEQLVTFLGDRVIDSTADFATNISATSILNPGKKGTLSFAIMDYPEELEVITSSESSIILLHKSMFDLVSNETETGYISVEDPRREFGRIVEEFFIEQFEPGIHPTAVIDGTASVGEGVYVGPYAVVSENVSIGDSTWIGPNVTILKDTLIGSSCTIGPGTVVGFAGFGYTREDDGTPLLVPHTGGVVIGDRVDIGSNTSIDRGTIGNTVIEHDVKIDNLVHIAHNCHIEAGAFIIANSMLAGRAHIGARAWIAPNVAIREGLEVGEDALVGLAAVVTKNVDSGSVVIGNPARKLSR